MAGGGIKGGVVHGETDEFSYNITQDPVHVRDLQATILHQFGIDHERFSYKYQGLDVKLTGVEKGQRRQRDPGLAAAVIPAPSVIGEELVRFDVRHRFDLTSGPLYFEPVHRRRGTESEVQTKIALRHERRTRAHFVHQPA